MIPIKNIYYMLAYAFHSLREGAFRRLACEDFSNIDNLLAEIIIIGTTSLVKRGLLRDYETLTEQLSSPRGKINITATIKSSCWLNKKLDCSYDEYTENSEFNRIIKTTCSLLLHNKEVNSDRKKKIHKLMVYFSNASLIDLHLVDWNKRFNRNTQIYRMLIYVCHWLYLRKLQTQEVGNKYAKDYSDEKELPKLYEKFIYEFFKQEYPAAFSVSASHIEWQLDSGEDTGLLPKMITDVTLEKDSKVLIIDAKYYSKETYNRYGKDKLKSGNLYQIFAYVKNKAWEMRDSDTVVSGMLLYAKTDSEITLDKNYSMSGNQISVKNLDLNVPFEELRKPLDEIAKGFVSK